MTAIHAFGNKHAISDVYRDAARRRLVVGYRILKQPVRPTLRGSSRSPLAVPETSVNKYQRMTHNQGRPQDMWTFGQICNSAPLQTDILWTFTSQVRAGDQFRGRVPK